MAHVKPLIMAVTGLIMHTANSYFINITNLSQWFTEDIVNSTLRTSNKICLHQLYLILLKQRNWVIAVLMPISLQPDGVYLWYFKLGLFKNNKLPSLKYLRPSTLGGSDYGDLKIRVCGKDPLFRPSLD